MLSEVTLPATAPQPSVMAGNTLVVMPVEPCGEGVFTSTRMAGMRRPYSRMRASLVAWITAVWPMPPNFSSASQVSSAACEIGHEIERKHRREFLRRERMLFADAAAFRRR